MWKAAKHGCLDQVEQFLAKANLEKNCVGHFGNRKWTILGAAVSSGNIKLIKRLLQHDVFKNEAKCNGESLLHIATVSNHSHIIKFLVNRFPGLRSEICKSRFPKLDLLETAVSGGFLQCVKTLAGFGAQVDAINGLNSSTLLHTSALNEQFETAKYLLENFSDVRDMIDEENDDGDTALDYALGKKNWKMAELIIKYMQASEENRDIFQTIYSHQELFHLDIVALQQGQ